MLLAWILLGGLLQLLSKPFGGQGIFEDMLAVAGFSLCVPMFITWIPETAYTVLMFLGAVPTSGWGNAAVQPGWLQAFLAVYQYVTLAYYVVLVGIATAVVQRVRRWQAGVLGMVGVAVVGLVVLVFIR